MLQDFVALETRDDDVRNRVRFAHERQHLPEAAGVVLSAVFAVPLVDTSVHVVLVVREPQFRDESWEADEKRGVEETLATKEPMASVAYPSQPKPHEQHTRRVDARRLDGRLAINATRRSVRETDHDPDPLSGQVHAPTQEQSNGIQNARRDGSRRDPARERRLDVRGSVRVHRKIVPSGGAGLGRSV